MSIFVDPKICSHIIFIIIIKFYFLILLLLLLFIFIFLSNPPILILHISLSIHPLWIYPTQLTPISLHFWDPPLPQPVSSFSPSPLLLFSYTSSSSFFFSPFSYFFLLFFSSSIFTFKISNFKQTSQRQKTHTIFSFLFFLILSILITHFL